MKIAPPLVSFRSLLKHVDSIAPVGSYKTDRGIDKEFCSSPRQPFQWESATRAMHSFELDDATRTWPNAQAHDIFFLNEIDEPVNFEEHDKFDGEREQQPHHNKKEEQTLAESEKNLRHSSSSSSLSSSRKAPARCEWTNHTSV